MRFGFEKQMEETRSSVISRSAPTRIIQLRYVTEIFIIVIQMAVELLIFLKLDDLK